MELFAIILVLSVGFFIVKEVIDIVVKMVWGLIKYILPLVLFASFYFTNASINEMQDWLDNWWSTTPYETPSQPSVLELDDLLGKYGHPEVRLNYHGDLLTIDLSLVQLQALDLDQCKVYVEDNQLIIELPVNEPEESHFLSRKL